ncbi:MAG: permease-like cell division protein FtsX [Tidjanibacter sp.]|nr:permease-like cell division protein FtsX [Tidjanibacter sp.]MBQ6604410.1 permease-like cell division protein FtsX [Tidjanibacter sp.]
MAQQENKRLRRKVRNSYFISTVSISLVLFLLGSVGYLIMNALRATEQMQESMTIYVMLDNDISTDDANAVGTRLHAMEEVRDAVFVSKEAAAEDFKHYVGGDFEEFLEYNPLPDSWEVRMKSDYSTREAVEKFEKSALGWQGVDEVVYQKNVVEQIGSNIRSFNLVLLLFGGTLLFISLILLNNTIRVSIFSKRYLINTMKLVGASKGFIMRPFLWDSFKQGLVSGLIATALFMAMIAGLNSKLPDVMMLAGDMPILIIVGAMMAGGVVISLLFTTFALNKFINMNTARIHLY